MHQLALPLPGGTPSVERRGRYSIFSCRTKVLTSTSDEDSCPVYSGLDNYLDRLCAFMQRTRLVQRHPDKYFHYIRGDEWRTTSAHLDGTTVTQEELSDTMQLCDAFVPLLSGPDAMRNLGFLVRDGPHGLPGGDAGPQCLTDFFEESRQLMLHRTRDTDTEAMVSTTLMHQASAENHEKPRTDADVTNPTKRQGRGAQAQRVLKTILAQGMNPKKQHEVQIMRDVVSSVVHCRCRSSACHRSSDDDPYSSPTEKVENQQRNETNINCVINIGEGKGYLSRALAFCDGLQVVGLDCNPAHQEKAIGQMEQLVDASLSLANAPTGADVTNLMYVKRGSIHSVVCSVGAELDWKAVLSPHVPVVEDGTNRAVTTRPGAGHGVIPEAVSTGLQALRAGGQTAATNRGGSDDTRSQTMKLVCTICGRVFHPKMNRGTQLVAHLSDHLRDGTRVNLPTRLDGISSLPRSEVKEWEAGVPPTEYEALVSDLFYTPMSMAAPGDSVALPLLGVKSARDRPAAAGEAQSEQHNGINGSDSARLNREDELSAFAARGCELVYVSRGMRVRGQRFVTDAKGLDDNVMLSREYRQEQCVLTVLGYDCASRRHRAVFDDGSSRVSVLLFSLAAPRVPHSLESEDRQLFGAAQAVLVKEIVPPPLIADVPVAVPSLRNCASIGLHTCGDLGSNVCRLFAHHRSPALVLVSCCWQSLTAEGFPLSRALRSRGMTVEKLSLLLATQPIDKWTTGSSSGHTSSARLLFFRSLLSLLWEKLGERWHSQRNLCTASSNPDQQRLCACPLVECPHLDPCFLRRIGREKSTLTFGKYASLVVNEYCVREKDAAFCWNRNTICANCRNTQREFLLEQVPQLSVTFAEDLVQKHFPRFLGYTVLRMWICHLVESVFLLDRTLYLHEQLSCQSDITASSVALVPLFDGAISPRMFGILARRW